MKNFIKILLAVFLSWTLCACSQKSSSSNPSIDQETQDEIEKEIDELDEDVVE